MYVNYDYAICHLHDLLCIMLGNFNNGLKWLNLYLNPLPSGVSGCGFDVGDSCLYIL